jgi:hypothetical protein
MSGWITYKKSIVKPALDGCGMEWEAELPANGIVTYSSRANLPRSHALTNVICHVYRRGNREEPREVQVQ